MRDTELSPSEAEAILRKLAFDLSPAPSESRHPVTPLKKTEDKRKSVQPAAPTTRPEGRPDGKKAKAFVLTEERYQSLLEAVPDALVVVNRDGAIVLVNSQTETMFEYRREELLGQPVELLIPERYRDKHVDDRADYFATPSVRPMGNKKDLYGRRRSGQEFPVEISLSPMVTADDTFAIGTIRDISERKRAEAQLRKAEARYRALVEEIPAVTFMAALDEGLNELYVSPQIESLLGFSQKEWLEDPVLWYARLHPDDRTRWHVEFARTIATGEPFHSEYRFLARDGRVVWVLGQARVARDELGRPLFLQGIAFDITAMKQAEAELKALNQTLEQRVQERTQAVEERARELERSNLALQDFNIFVGHELKKPLFPIRDDAQELVRSYKGKPDPAARERLERIYRLADDMWVRIGRMLEYDEIGKVKMELRATDCAAVFCEARDHLRGEIEESDAVVTASRLPTVVGHKEDLVQVFENLIGNAIKYRAQNRALKVRVGAERQDREWLFWVKDNGEGIEPHPKDPDFIFRLFKRNHGEEIPGHGIGLAFCKKVIEHHGGQIWVESQFGRGSTFYFTLPAMPHPEPPQDSQTSEQLPTSAPPASESSPSTRGKTRTRVREKPQSRGRRGG
jgi:PAS domain S-box-containing protein